MPHDLENVFRELGLAQYLDVFVEQGFDSWEIILDIQESDLDALGVKLGHRRKLQRHIANAKGIAPSVSLASIKQSLEEAKQNGTRYDGIRSDNNHETNGVTKRKYRRHPKPDENAPERPPSAYVLFSNKMRDDLKSQNLTFTEIAKLVGENWQSLSPSERDVFERKANAAKDKYRRDMAEYKKTPQYRKYSQYLHEFKEKQARHTQAKALDTSKRTKYEPARLRHGSTSSSATPGGTTASSGTRSGSSSERLQDLEPPLSRQHRVDSVASMAGSPLSSAGLTPLSHRNSMDDPNMSPRSIQYDITSNRDLRAPQVGPWLDRDTGREHGQANLPPLSNMLADGREAHFNRSDGRRALPDGLPGTNIHSMPNGGKAPTNGSSHIRYGGDAPLPIHALLSTKESDIKHSNHEQYRGPTGYGFQNESSAFGRMRAEQEGDGDIVMTATDDHPPRQPAPKPKNNLDGMSALLRAGEIVDQTQRS
ncbi:hypothetical protein VHEMI10573 [[Torrubiella] hemipterigena]|uniref:HMG box domain-containing protein n=1 Tax=[Torrubiella] hemipterigena TaxID=1531966 RepID=A0A0A1TS27_9HYPO|nr:hypothetical protein VHEMI10573 [[Torrubiella] hemipterigena]